MKTNTTLIVAAGCAVLQFADREVDARAVGAGGRRSDSLRGRQIGPDRGAADDVAREGVGLVGEDIGREQAAQRMAEHGIVIPPADPEYVGAEVES